MKNILKVILIIIASPFILIFGLLFGIFYLLVTPYEKYKYKRSSFYLDTYRKYTFNIIYYQEYKFYNLLKKLDYNILVNTEDYINFEYNDQKFILSNFDDVIYDKKLNEFKIGIQERETNYYTVNEVINKLYIDNKFNESENIKIFVNEATLDLENDDLVKDFVANDIFVIYKDYYDILAYLDKEKTKKYTRNDIDKLVNSDIKLFSLFISLIYIGINIEVLLFIIQEANLSVSIIGGFFIIMILFLIFVLLDNARIFKKRIFPNINKFINILSLIGIIVLISFIINLF